MQSAVQGICQTVVYAHYVKAREMIIMVNDLYEGVMKTIKWKRLNVPVKKNPFPEDEKW